MIFFHFFSFNFFIKLDLIISIYNSLCTNQSLAFYFERVCYPTTSLTVTVLDLRILADYCACSQHALVDLAVVFDFSSFQKDWVEEFHIFADTAALSDDAPSYFAVVSKSGIAGDEIVVSAFEFHLVAVVVGEEDIFLFGSSD